MKAILAVLATMALTACAPFQQVKEVEGECKYTPPSVVKTETDKVAYPAVLANDQKQCDNYIAKLKEKAK